MGFHIRGPGFSRLSVCGTKCRLSHQETCLQLLHLSTFILATSNSTSTVWMSWPSSSNSLPSEEEGEPNGDASRTAGGCGGDRVSWATVGHGIECTDEKPLHQEMRQTPLGRNPRTNPSLPKSIKPRRKARGQRGTCPLANPSFGSSRERFSPAMDDGRDLVKRRGCNEQWKVSMQRLQRRHTNSPSLPLFL